MMREFQAENERRRSISESNIPALLNVNSNEMILQSISNDQPQTPTRQKKINTPERRSNFDRNKSNVKTNTLKVSLFLIQ
jgi:hypothetical protein